MRVLVIKPSSIGDIIHTLPAIRIIKKNFPNSHISWVVFDQFRQFAELFSDVDEIIVFRRREWAKLSNSYQLLQFFYRLRRAHFDFVLDFQGLFRSGIIAFFAKSLVKVGFADAREGSSFFYRDTVSPPVSAKHAVEKNIYLVNHTFKTSDCYSSPHFRTDPEIVTKACTLLKKFGFEKNDYLVALAPGARWLSKIWPSFFFLR